MLGPGAYLMGAAEVAIVLAAICFTAYRLRGRILPSWNGPPARLAEAILGLTTLILLGEVLGTVHLLKDIPLVLGALAVAFATQRYAEGSDPQKQRSVPQSEYRGSDPTASQSAPKGSDPTASQSTPRGSDPIALLGALLAVGLVFAHWGFEAKTSLDLGITNFDSLWYHMPFAAEIAQKGSTTGLHFTDPLFVNWFYPQNSELIHAVGIVLTGRDALSLFLNFGWLATALLAAWCIGRPYGRGPLAVTIAAAVLEAHTLVVREPGAAKNDVVGAALLLATMAILITPGPRRLDRNVLIVAGLAAGLAVGTKLTVAAPVVVLTLGVLAYSEAGERRKTALAFGGPMLLAGGYWYLRNLFTAGNPVPWVKDLGPITLPGPERLQKAREDFSIVHYLTDTDVWRHYFEPGVHQAFGGLWPLVLIVGLIGSVFAIRSANERFLRLGGIVALLGFVAYLFTPLGAAGDDGNPVAFAINIRFVVPSLLLGAVLFANVSLLEGRNRQRIAIGAVILFGAFTNRADAVLRDPDRVFGIILAVGLIGIPAGLLLIRHLAAESKLAARYAAVPLAGLATLLIAIMGAGYPISRSYERDRFESFESPYSLESAYAWAQDEKGTRIGLAGTTAGLLSYGFYGRDLSNEVTYLGKHGKQGSFSAIPTCTEFRQAVNDADLDYLVTSPFLHFDAVSHPILSPEAGWVKTDPALKPIITQGPVTVWKLKGELEPNGCAALDVPQRVVPDQ